MHLHIIASLGVALDGSLRLNLREGKTHTGCRELACFQDKWIPSELNHNFGAQSMRPKRLVLAQHHSAAGTAQFTSSARQIPLTSLTNDTSTIIWALERTSRPVRVATRSSGA